MHPYRDPPSARVPIDPPPEERVVYGLCIAIGIIPVAAVVTGGGFGVNATLGSLMVIAGVAGLRSMRRL
jgi:nitrate reductase NapE component